MNQTLKNYFFKAQVITVEPLEQFNEEYQENDFVITKEQMDRVEWKQDIQALVIRTIPNSNLKEHKDYSSTNPPYMDVRCLEVMNKNGIDHLLLDLPSVDRETDGGKLLFHHAFWGVPERPNFERTITELIYLEESITDGIYLLELQMASFENDASPSRPVLYAIKKA